MNLFLAQPNSNVDLIMSHKKKHQSSKNTKTTNVNIVDSDEDPIMV